MTDTLHKRTEPTGQKLHELKQLLSKLGSVLVAYSGGVDSTFLLKVALDALGSDHVLAVTARSPFRPASETAEAEELARELGARHLLVDVDELEDPELVHNPPQRCYRCKRSLFAQLRDIADREGLRGLVDGSNASDSGQHRPGLRALRELGVRSPLAELEVTKDEIRLLSRQLGLPTWNRPAQSCLATRFPYGEALTREKLQRVDAAEDVLRDLGFGQLRVRSHGSIARVEVSAEEMADLLRRAAAVASRLKELGYAYVTMDLEGFRSGSMDEVTSKEQS